MGEFPMERVLCVDSIQLSSAYQRGRIGAIILGTTEQDVLKLQVADYLSVNAP